MENWEESVASEERRQVTENEEGVKGEIYRGGGKGVMGRRLAGVEMRMGLTHTLLARHCCANLAATKLKIA